MALDATSTLTLKRLNFFRKTLEAKGFFQFEIIINVLALSDKFEYLCYGSTAIRNISNLTCLQCGERRQILTSKVDPRAIRVNPFSAETIFRRQKLKYKVDPRTERVKYL